MALLAYLLSDLPLFILPGSYIVPDQIAQPSKPRLGNLMLGVEPLILNIFRNIDRLHKQLAVHSRRKSRCLVHLMREQRGKHINIR